MKQSCGGIGWLVGDYVCGVEGRSVAVAATSSRRSSAGIEEQGTRNVVPCYVPVLLLKYYYYYYYYYHKHH